MNSSHSRRQFNRLLGGALLSPACWPLSQSAWAKDVEGARFSFSHVHLEAAQQAKRLAAAQPMTLSILFPKGSLGNLKPVTDQFSTLTGIQFDFIEVPVDDINTAMFLSASAGRYAFDIALPATFGIPDLVEAGVLANLDPWVRRYQPKNFSNDALYTIGSYYRGAFYGYQTDGDAYLMFYNQAMLEDEQQDQRFYEQHGYHLKVPETWEELDQMMAFFHRPKQSQYGGALFRQPGYIAWEWWVRFHAKGLLPLADDLTPQINHEGGVRALEELVAASKFLYSGARTNGLFENWKAYADGRIFANIGWGGTQKYLNSEQSAVKNRLAFSATPGGWVDGELLQTPYFNWGWNYTVAANSPSQEIAYLFTLFACSPTPSTMAVREASGYFDPFRTEHYQDADVIKAYGRDFLAAHQHSLKNCIPDFYMSGQGQYMDALSHYLMLADRGQYSPKQALDTVAKIWLKLNRDQGIERQKEQWAYLKKHYPQNAMQRLR